jgi:hypothetical protein
VGDDCAASRAVSALFVRAFSGINQQLAPNVMHSSLCEHVYALRHRDTVLRDLWLRVDRK